MAKRILVPLDRSGHSEAVVPLVADLARGSGATVRVLHVAPVLDTVTDAGGRVIAYADQEMASLQAESMDYLEAVKGPLGDLPVQCVVRFGDPVEEIAGEADAWGADLLVFTTGWRCDLGRIFLGSTAEQVCRRIAVPVMIVRPGEA
jgi:nucleotide-binding universal stress UspA family protein